VIGRYCDRVRFGRKRSRYCVIGYISYAERNGKFRRSLASVGSTGGANKNLHTATVRTTHPLKPSLDPEYGLVGLLGLGGPMDRFAKRF
jgi:hypothetical protein